MSPPAPIEEIAAAKINLYLHIGGLRPDGFHELESLFVFTDDGDRLSVTAADDLSLTVEGPFAEALAGASIEDNLVWRAAKLLGEKANVRSGAAMVLEKRLPIAAGIGGGSADAAAALRALSRLWSVRLDDRDLQALAFSLGADVPACLSRAPVYVSGAGEIVEPGPALPELWIALVNPGVAMPTGPIFKAFDAANPDPVTPQLLKFPDGLSARELQSMLLQTTNDLQPHAIGREPVIGEAVDFLAHCSGAMGARMSGSGGTAFSLFAAHEGARAAAEAARKRGWWSMAARLAAAQLAAAQAG